MDILTAALAWLYVHPPCLYVAGLGTALVGISRHPVGRTLSSLACGWLAHLSMWLSGSRAKERRIFMHQMAKVSFDVGVAAAAPRPRTRRSKAIDTDGRVEDRGPDRGEATGHAQA